MPHVREHETSAFRPFAPFQRRFSGFLRDPTNRANLAIGALGGNPEEAASVRSAAFGQRVAQLEGETPEEFLNRQFDIRRRRLESVGSARGIGEGGELAGEVLNLEQDRATQLANLPPARGGAGGSRQRRPGPTVSQPGGPPTGRLPAPPGGGVPGEGIPDLELADFDAASVDREALERQLREGQQQFTNLQRTATGSGVNVGGVFLPPPTGGSDEVRRQGLAAMRSDFGTLQPAARVTRNPGENLSDFLRREKQEQSDPRNMTKATLAGKTLQLIGMRDGARQQMQNAIDEFNSGDALAELRTLQSRAQFAAAQAGRGVEGADNSARRLRNELQQRSAALQSEVRENLALQASRVAQADASIRANVKILNEKAALTSRLNTRLARDRAQGLDQNLYQRMARQMGVDPQEINQTTGLPQWQHMRMFVDQDDARRTLIESNVTRQGRALRERVGLSALEQIEEQIQGAARAEEAKKPGSRRGSAASSQQSSSAGQFGSFGGGTGSLFNTGGIGGFAPSRSVFGTASGLPGQF